MLTAPGPRARLSSGSVGCSFPPSSPGPASLVLAVILILIML